MSLLLGKGDSPITAEQVLGKREEVYWQKVPEKFRRQAARNKGCEVRLVSGNQSVYDNEGRVQIYRQLVTPPCQAGHRF